jgi:hypothetical protein
VIVTILHSFEREPNVGAAGRHTHSAYRDLARKPNYDFEKRKKEQDRKAKKDAKREERLARKRAGLDPDLVEMEGEGGAADGEPADAEDAGDEVTG